MPELGNDIDETIDPNLLDGNVQEAGYMPSGCPQHGNLLVMLKLRQEILQGHELSG